MNANEVKTDHAPATDDPATDDDAASLGLWDAPAPPSPSPTQAPAPAPVTPAKPAGFSILSKPPAPVPSPDPARVTKNAQALAQAAGTGGTISLLERQLDREIEKRKLPVLGALVWWTFSGVETTVDDLKAKVTQAGLDPKHVPVPEPRGALTDGIKSLGLKTRIGRHKVDASRFAVSLERPQVAETGGPTVDVDYTIEQVVEYNFDTKLLSFKTDLLKTEITSAYMKFLTALQSSDLRTTVMRTLADSNAITVRERGGVYFVPRQALDVVDKLRTLCGSVPGAEFNRLRIADEPEERADMLKSAGAEIEGEIREAEADLAELIERSNKGEQKVAESTFKRRIERFKEIQGKALAYKDLLNFKAEDVAERLGQLAAKATFVMESL